jgi:hypothetical protein
MLDSEKFLRVFSAKILRAKHHYESSVFQKNKLKNESDRLASTYKRMLNDISMSQQQEESLREQCEAVRRQREEQEQRCLKDQDEINSLKWRPDQDPEAQAQAGEGHR